MEQPGVCNSSARVLKMRTFRDVRTSIGQDRNDMQSRRACGRHLLKSWSTGQSAFALSCSEAELYALTKVAAQTLGIISMAADVGKAKSAMVHADPKAAC